MSGWMMDVPYAVNIIIYSWTKQNTVIMYNYIYIAIAIYLYINKCIHACMCIYMQNFMYEQYMDVKYVM